MVKLKNSDFFELDLKEDLKWFFTQLLTKMSLTKANIRPYEINFLSLYPCIELPIPSSMKRKKGARMELGCSIYSLFIGTCPAVRVKLHGDKSSTYNLRRI